MKKLILVILTVVLSLNAFVFAANASESDYSSDIKNAILEVAKENNEELNDFQIIFIKVDGDEKTLEISGRYTVTEEKNGEKKTENFIWSETYELNDETYLSIVDKTGTENIFSAYDDSAVSKEVADIIVKIIDPEDVTVEYKGFGREGMGRNLKYMGLGMLGIFVVVGIVILITFVLNTVTSKKK